MLSNHWFNAYTIVININIVDLLFLVCMAVDKHCHLSKLSAVTLLLHTHDSFEFAVWL